MTLNERYDILLERFKKVSEYVKENYSDCLLCNYVKEIVHSPYHWVKAVVTTDGTLVLGRGDHSDEDKPERVVVDGMTKTAWSRKVAYLDKSDGGAFRALDDAKNCIFPPNEMVMFLSKWTQMKAELEYWKGMWSDDSFEV